MANEELAAYLNKKTVEKLGGENQRLATMLGMLTNDKDQPIKANPTKEEKSQFNQERYRFFLDAPFEISNVCCNVMKKAPLHKYVTETGRKAITAQMASESRLRTTKWLQNGCNGFNMKYPVSNPMSFWTEQDVLLYILENQLQICKVYGDIVTDYGSMGLTDGQMNLSDFGLFDLKRPLLKTTGCNRTGCMFCGFGCHLEKSPNGRFERMKETHPKRFEYVIGGGEFNENGIWHPSNKGLGMWFVILWTNIHGGLNIPCPDLDLYRMKYSTEETERYLKV